MVLAVSEQVEKVTAVFRGWIQNLARNAAGEGWILEPWVVVDALGNLIEEYRELVDPDWAVLEDWLDIDEDE